MSGRNLLAPPWRARSEEADTHPPLISVVFLALVDTERKVSLFNFRHYQEE